MQLRGFFALALAVIVIGFPPALAGGGCCRRRVPGPPGARGPPGPWPTAPPEGSVVTNNGTAGGLSALLRTNATSVITGSTTSSSISLTSVRTNTITGETLAAPGTTVEPLVIPLTGGITAVISIVLLSSATLVFNSAFGGSLTPVILSSRSPDAAAFSETQFAWSAPRTG